MNTATEVAARVAQWDEQQRAMNTRGETPDAELEQLRQQTMNTRGQMRNILAGTGMTEAEIDAEERRAAEWVRSP